MNIPRTSSDNCRSGASGAIFGIIALTLLDLLYHWKERLNPKKELLFIMLDVVIAFVLGLLPGLDNFAHIGGFIMGLGLGISILHSPQALRERIGVDEPPYSAVPNPKHGEGLDTNKNFAKQPIGFFKGRKPLWWAWWLIRAGFIIIVIVAFIVLLNNFYVNHNTCKWCKYLSCLVSSASTSPFRLSLSSNQFYHSPSVIGATWATWSSPTPRQASVISSDSNVTLYRILILLCPRFEVLLHRPWSGSLFDSFSFG